VREWLAADADARTPKDQSLSEGVSCDEIGCVARLADGTIVALPFVAQAFEEDCPGGRAGGEPAHRAARIARPPRSTAACGRRAVRTCSIGGPRTGKRSRPIRRAMTGHGRRQHPRQDGANVPAPSQPPARDATPRAEDLGAED
jgi:competence protein ComEC